MKKIVIFALSIYLLLLPFPVQAQMERVEAKITRLQGNSISVLIKEGPQVGKEYLVALFDNKQIGSQNLEVGDEVIISFIQVQGGEQRAVIVDHVRRTPLIILAGLFFSAVLLVGRKKGILSLIAMMISFLIIGRLILPQILLGNNPVLVSLIGALFIIPTLFYISHGFNTKTTVAVVGTFLSLIVTGILAVIFVHITRLTGFAAEEATFIQASGQNVDIQSLLLAGIIIGAMGVLDDITISQTSIVEKLAKANPKYTQ